MAFRPQVDRPIGARPGENLRQTLSRQDSERRARIHAELFAAQEILKALDAQEISPRLASQQIQRHLAKAKQMVGRV